MRIALTLIIGALVATTAKGGPDAPSPGTERHYCTQYGPFFIRFDEDKAAGVFAILTNGDLGSMVGALEGRRLEGEWVEVDSGGAIRIEFSEDWSTFEAEYNLAPEPETWHGDWRGHLRPTDDTASFVRDGVEFRCQ